MTPETLARATGSTAADAQKYCSHLNEAMLRFNIKETLDRCCFIATLDVESSNLSGVEEGLYYKDAARLASVYPRVFSNDPAKAAPYTRNSAKLGQLLYQGYWGRGLIQLTWLKNYIEAGNALGFDYVNNPKLLTEPWHAAMSAAWFWDHNGVHVPALKGDMDGVTRIVNGPKLMHLAERKAAFQQCLKAGI